MRRALPLFLLTFLSAAAYAGSPETVAVTYRFSKPNETPLREVIQKHWSVGKRLNLMTGAHQLYRGDGFFLEIFTWKDASIPDNPPADVRALWDEMERLVDKSGGKPGIEIEEVSDIDRKE